MSRPRVEIGAFRLKSNYLGNSWRGKVYLIDGPAVYLVMTVQRPAHRAPRPSGRQADGVVEIIGHRLGDDLGLAVNTDTDQNRLVFSTLTGAIQILHEHLQMNDAVTESFQCQLEASVQVCPYRRSDRESLRVDHRRHRFIHADLPMSA